LISQNQRRLSQDIALHSQPLIRAAQLRDLGGLIGERRPGAWRYAVSDGEGAVPVPK
jgi:hypothetical protein